MTTRILTFGSTGDSIYKGCVQIFKISNFELLANCFLGSNTGVYMRIRIQICYLSRWPNGQSHLHEYPV